MRLPECAALRNGFASLELLTAIAPTDTRRLTGRQAPV